MIEVTNANGDIYRYNYNSNKDITEIINPLGITVVRNTYNGFHQVVRQVLADDSEFQFRYDLPNYRTYMKDRSGIVRTYQQDEKYQNLSAADIEGGEQKEYNLKGQITKHTDRNGNVTRCSYDNRGNQIQVIDAEKRKWDFAYTKDDQVKRVRLGGIDRYQIEYDEQGDPIRMTDALKRITRVQYNNERKPLSLTQPDGSKIQLNYDARGNIIKLVTPVGVTEYTYDALNRVIASKNGNGHVTRFAYNAKDELVEVENAEGNRLTYTYNGVGKVTRAVNYDGSVQEWEYDVCSQPAVYRDALQRETIYRYNRMGKISQMILPDGAEQSYEYDLKRRLIKETNGIGSTRSYTYDSNGNLASVTDGEGNTTDYTYDGLNRLSTITDPIEGLTSYQYDADGNLCEIIDPDGNSSRMEYDEAGQLIKETDVLGNVTEYTYTPLGKVNTIRDAADRVTRYEYLPGGILKGIIYPDGTKESYGYDANGNMTEYTNKSGFTLTYEYDSLDRIIAIRGSEGELKTYVYDAVGNVCSMTDALGNKTAYEYSPTGNLIKVTDAAGYEVEYAYDPCDRLIEIRQYGEVIEGALQPPESKDAELRQAQKRNEINRRCQITTYQRNKAGQVEKIRNALGEEEFYQYDKEGRLIKKEDRDGYVTRYGYTPLGDLNEIQYGDGREVKMQYNALRQLIMAEDWLGQLNIEVDANGRAREVTYPDGKKVAYTYGSHGERTSITYPDGKEVKYKYDPYLRLSEVKSDDLEVTYGYDEAGRLAEKKFQNGMNSRYRYDQKGQLRELVHSDLTGELDRYEYGYDLLGNKNHIKKQRRGLIAESGSYEYQYDALNRLSGVKKDGVIQREYAYDPFHNRSSMKEWVMADGSPNPESSVRTDYVYDIAGRLASLTKAPEGKVYNDSIEGDQLNGIPVHEETYNYDRRGNLTHIYKDGQLVNQYYFGALNRLESAMNYESGLGATYKYNGLGHRVGNAEGTPIGPVLPINKLQNMSLKPTKQIDDVIDLTKQYHNLLQRNENDKDTAFTWDNNVLSSNQNDGSYYQYLQDELGSPIRYIGKEQEIYSYDEFGKALYGNKKINQPFTYTGYQQDEITGIYYAQARQFSPQEGRFTSKDIIKGNVYYPFTLNEYSYCWNQPIDLVDNDGELPTIVIGAIIGGVIGGVGSAVLDVASGREIDWGKAGKSFVKGAVAGAVVGTGVGIVAGGTTAVIGGGAATMSSVSVVGTAASTPTWLVGVGVAPHGISRSPIFPPVFKKALISNTHIVRFSIMATISVDFFSNYFTSHLFTSFRLFHIHKIIIKSHNNIHTITVPYRLHRSCENIF